MLRGSKTIIFSSDIRFFGILSTYQINKKHFIRYQKNRNDDRNKSASGKGTLNEKIMMNYKYQTNNINKIILQFNFYKFLCQSVEGV